MTPVQDGPGASSMASPGPTRRSVLGAALAAWLAGPYTPARAAGPAAGALIDVLERPAPVARIATAAPMLRIARCGRRLVCVGERGVVLFSDDDGHRWQQAQVPVSVTLTGVQFTSDKRGFAIGHGGVVLRSDDAGQTWQRLLDGRRPELDAVDKPWLALHFADDRHGLIVGAFGMAMETSDGGQTWQSFADRLPNPGSLHLHAVHRRGEKVWIAGEQGLYALSTDAGRRYAVQPTPYRGSFFALCVLDDGQAVLGGLRGTLLLHEGGDKFRPLAAASSQGVAELLPIEVKSVALVDQSDRLFTASLADLQFKPVTASPARTWLAVAQAADGAFVGASFDGVSRLQAIASSPKT